MTYDLAAALAAATAGDTVQVPPGVHVCTPAAVPAGVTLAGAGMGATVLTFPAEPVAADAVALSVSGVGSTTIRDLTLVGPAVGANPGTQKYAFGVRMAATPTGQHGALTMERVRIDRPTATITTGFHRALFAEAGAGTGSQNITLDGCDLTASNGVANVYVNPGGVKTLRATNTVLRDAGASHLLYAHPAVRLDFTGCTFHAPGPSSYSLHHYSASSVVGADATFTGCRFSGGGLGALTSDQSGRTLFDACTFDQASAGSAAAVNARHPVTLTGCRFSVAPGSIGVRTTGLPVTIDGCTFASLPGAGGGGAMVSVAGGSVEVRSSVFDLSASTTGAPKALWARVATGVAAVRATGCSFVANRSGDGPTAVYAGQGAAVTLDACRGSGVWSSMRGFVHVDHAAATVAAEGCDIAVSAPAVFLSPGVPAGAYSET